MDVYYFHPDHLGSSSYITNMAGMVSQHMEYLPFGELLVDEHKNSYNSPFKYNGKEFDEETGNYFYGARYYDPKWSIFISVDPLAEKYPNISPYAYVANNPINLIDPDGRDIWELNETGNVTNRIENTEIDQFVIVDSKGKRTEGDTYKYGTVTERKGHKDDNGKDLTLFEVNGDENAKAIFEFFGDNYTDNSDMPLEWSHIKVGKEDSGRNIIGTSHQSRETSVGHYIRETGYTLREGNHNHPGGTNPSGNPSQPGRPATGDIRGAELYEAASPNIKLNIYRSRTAYPSRGGYHPYDSRGYIPYTMPGWQKLN